MPDAVARKELTVRTRLASEQKPINLDTNAPIESDIGSMIVKDNGAIQMFVQ